MFRGMCRSRNMEREEKREKNEMDGRNTCSLAAQKISFFMFMTGESSGKGKKGMSENIGQP